jgi:hypothetical protein
VAACDGVLETQRTGGGVITNKAHGNVGDFCTVVAHPRLRAILQETGLGAGASNRRGYWHGGATSWLTVAFFLAFFLGGCVGQIRSN